MTVRHGNHIDRHLMILGRVDRSFALLPDADVEFVLLLMLTELRVALVDDHNLWTDYRKMISFVVTVRRGAEGDDAELDLLSVTGSDHPRTGAVSDHRQNVVAQVSVAQVADR